MRFIRADGTSHSLTYAELLEQTSRFAGVLRGLGIERGDRVFSLTGRIPELYVAVLGTLRHAAVFCPLFSAFGAEPVRQRLELGGGRALITTRALYRKKVAPIRDRLPQLQHVLLVDAADEPEPGTLDLAALMREAPPYGEIAETHPEDMALLHFTSGTTGTPKGAIHVHDAVTAHFATGRFALDLHPDDIYWCTADPGWVTGTSYGVIAPLVHGVTSIVDEEEMEADRWYRILADQRVSVWYTAPTALRMLMKAGTERATAHDLSALRFVASVGEPLNPEVVVWGQEAFGLPVHDNWWQTETSGIMISNYVATEDPPGLDGPPPARRRGRPGSARRAGHTRHAGRRTRAGDRTGCRGRAGPAPRLALDVPRVPQRGGALPPVLRGQLVPHRRPGPEGRGPTAGSSVAGTT
ncbi:MULTISPECIES: AMP-binding protein [Cryobacterium]|uniref:AMP-binding protein n=1 Tax=Cryobacterium TaxID=69578 RepID=UPI0030BA06A6